MLIPNTYNGNAEEEQNWQQKKKEKENWRDIGPTLSKSDGKTVHTSNEFQANEFQIEYIQSHLHISITVKLLNVEDSEKVLKAMR